MGGVGRRFGPIGSVGLVEDIAHVVTHGPGADEQLSSNFPVRLSDGHQAQHFELSLAQAIGVARRSNQP